MDKTQELERRIVELEKWKSERINQQITFPLDNQSIEILNKYFMRIVNSITYLAGGTYEYTEYIGKQDNKEFTVGYNTYIPYTVNLTTNEIVIDGFMSEDRSINIVTTDTEPSPLSTAVTYYAIQSTDSTFKLTTVQGDNAYIVTLTDKGVGYQYLYSLGF